MKGTRTPGFFGMKVGLVMPKDWPIRSGTYRGSGVAIPWANDRIDINLSAYAFNVRELEDVVLVGVAHLTSVERVGTVF